MTNNLTLKIINDLEIKYNNKKNLLEIEFDKYEETEFAYYSSYNYHIYCLVSNGEIIDIYKSNFKEDVDHTCYGIGSIINKSILKKINSNKFKKEIEKINHNDFDIIINIYDIDCCSDNGIRKYNKDVYVQLKFNKNDLYNRKFTFSDFKLVKDNETRHFYNNGLENSFTLIN